MSEVWATLVTVFWWASYILATMGVIIIVAVTIIQILSFLGLYETAHDKAHKLFLRMLSDQQKRTLLYGNYIIVQGNVSKDYYCIRVNRGYSGNIWKINKEKYIREKVLVFEHRYCYLSDINVPHYDNFLGQKLIIECDEAHFMSHGAYLGRP